ncbi:hypothetical protein HNQ65_005167 [Prosthecobacter vanneervenii]|uniref:Uncharacterized protein n=1 Tax=Prosthecobacter vanneervenii TaxID=48466 RepID=A0A7W8DMK3_9BACT|nr:hypothetical protein [Prosthecobacter vanneervenii]
MSSLALAERPSALIPATTARVTIPIKASEGIFLIQTSRHLKFQFNLQVRS